MSTFDAVAADWDMQQRHINRTKAITEVFRKATTTHKSMRALEFGAGTGLMSFELAADFAEIVMMDNSKGMVEVMQKKVAESGLNHLKPVLFDMETHTPELGLFDVIFTQMVFHHVHKTNHMLEALGKILKPGGILAIADLYPEDGSFHGYGFDGHLGFDPEKLGQEAQKFGFSQYTHQPCYELPKAMPDGSTKNFPLFMFVATKAAGVYYHCLSCDWTGTAEQVEFDVIETCMGPDKTEMCPKCGSLDVRER